MLVTSLDELCIRLKQHEVPGDGNCLLYSCMYTRLYSSQNGVRGIKAKCIQLRKDLCELLSISWSREFVNLIPFRDNIWCVYLVLKWLGELQCVNILVIMGCIGDNITPYQSFIQNIQHPYILLEWDQNHVKPLYQEFDDKKKKKQFEWNYGEISTLLETNKLFDIDVSFPEQKLPLGLLREEVTGDLANAEELTATVDSSVGLVARAAMVVTVDLTIESADVWTCSHCEFNACQVILYIIFCSRFLFYMYRA